jgi:hypothetical protein
VAAKTDNSTDSGAAEAREGHAARWGRRAGWVVYWLCVAFVVGAGMRGVTTGVFSAELPSGAGLQLQQDRDRGLETSGTRASCAEGARMLRRALDDEATAVVTGAHDERALLSALAAYDARARAHAASCAAQGDAELASVLARYRYAQERALLRHLREASPLAAELEALAAARTAGTPRSPGRPR